MFVCSVLGVIGVVSTLPEALGATFNPNLKFNFSLPAASPYVWYGPLGEWNAGPQNDLPIPPEAGYMQIPADYQRTQRSGPQFNFTFVGTNAYATMWAPNTSALPVMFDREDSYDTTPLGNDRYVLSGYSSTTMQSSIIHGYGPRDGGGGAILSIDIETAMYTEAETFNEVNCTPYSLSAMKDSAMFHFTGDWRWEDNVAWVYSGYIEFSTPRNTSFLSVNVTQTPDLFRDMYVKYDGSAPPLGTDSYNYFNHFESEQEMVVPLHFATLDPVQNYKIKLGCDLMGESIPCKFNDVTFCSYWKNGTGPIEAIANSDGPANVPTATTNDSHSGSIKAPVGVIVGATVGGGVTLLLLGVLIWWLTKRYARQPRKMDPSSFDVDESVDPATPFMSQQPHNLGTTQQASSTLQKGDQSGYGYSPNPLSSVTSGSLSDPSSSAPTGLFIEQDAGGLEPLERLPPTYNPEWAGSDATSREGPSSAEAALTQVSHSSQSISSHQALTIGDTPPFPTAGQEKAQLQAMYAGK